MVFWLSVIGKAGDGLKIANADRQRVFGLRVEKDKWLKKLIPLCHEGQYGRSCRNRNGKRHQNLPEDSQIVGAIYARRFVEVFRDSEAIVAPSGSCVATIHTHYADLLRDYPELADEVASLQARTYELSQYLVDVLGVGDVGSRLPSPVRATYHDCCHALRELGVQAQPRKLLSAVEGLELAEMKDSTSCCGFGGTFAVKYADISTAILREKLHNVEATGAEVLTAVDSSCLMHMGGALRREGAVLTPLPVAGADGELIQLVADDALAHPRHVVLFAWEDGAEPDEREQDLRGPFEALGEITARMHVHVRRWRKPAGFERFTWDFDTTLGCRPHWGAWRGGKGITPAIETLFARTVDLVSRRLARFGTAPERFDLIHGDLRLANLLIDGEATKVLDFDDCGFGWLMYDCATTVSFFEHRPEVPDLVEAWLRGYRKVLDLPRTDEEEIPTFVILRRLLLVAWIGSHSETELARSMGAGYTEGTVPLCEEYLSRFG